MDTRALIAASTKPMILSILWWGESYGYQIIKEVTRLSGGELEWTEAMLYPVLHRLERDRLIASRWAVSDEGRRRKYYALTERGRAELEAEKQAWLNVHDVFERLWGPRPELSLG